MRENSRVNMTELGARIRELQNAALQVDLLPTDINIRLLQPCKW